MGEGGTLELFHSPLPFTGWTVLATLNDGGNMKPTKQTQETEILDGMKYQHLSCRHKTATVCRMAMSLQSK